MVWLLTFLSVFGFLIAGYFTAITYRWINPQAGYLPQFCRMGEKTCAAVVFTPRARVFGVPNSLLGQIYYILLVFTLWRGWLWQAPVYGIVLAVSTLTVILGAYLTYSLLFLTRIPCKLCFTGHAINAAIWIILVAGDA
ncbi:MAG TPA: vitamin K epoxide reductase family protein [Acidobacteriota bacterium]|jgi:uncharacterized membrane protein